MTAIPHSPHLISTAEILRRVLLPRLRPQVTHHFHHELQRVQVSQSQRRYAKFAARSKGHRSQGNITPAKDTGPIRDEAISARDVLVVKPDSSLQPPRSLRDTLASIDRNACFLVQVGDMVHPSHSDDSEPEPGERDSRPRIPICKIIDKGAFRQAEAAKQKPKKSVVAMSKEVEINWTMSDHDLNHRLDRLKQFLDEGRRVDVVFGKKRKGWMRRKEATDQQANVILQKIREAVETVDGAKEWKTMEGQVKGQLLLFFEGKRDKLGIGAKK
ncbi:MAG: hypothetical protein Q9183_000703 [Haloplaca sp. 2 TL-2023]